MATQYRKLILLIILLAIPYPIWHAINYYAAGLVDQTALIEFGYEDDFMYCNDWRPELLDNKREIKGYKNMQRPIYEQLSYFGPPPIRWRLKQSPSMTVFQWASVHGHMKILKKLQSSVRIPVKISNLLSEIKPGMSATQVQVVILGYYPKYKRNGFLKWSGKTGYISYEINPEWLIMINFCNESGDLNLVNQDKLIHRDADIFIRHYKSKLTFILLRKDKDNKFNAIGKNNEN